MHHHLHSVKFEKKKCNNAHITSLFAFKSFFYFSVWVFNWICHYINKRYVKHIIGRSKSAFLWVKREQIDTHAWFFMIPWIRLISQKRERKWLMCFVNMDLSIMTYLGPPLSRALTVCRVDMAMGSMVRELFSTAHWTDSDNWRKSTGECQREKTDDQRKTCVLTHLRAGEWETWPDIFSVHPADERWGAIQTGRLLPREELCEQHRVQLDEREREFSLSCLKG